MRFRKICFPFAPPPGISGMEWMAEWKAPLEIPLMLLFLIYFSLIDIYIFQVKELKTYGVGINKRMMMVPNVARVLGGAFHYARPTAQRLVEIPDEKRNNIFRSNRANRRGMVLWFLPLLRIPYSSEIYWREVKQWIGLTKSKWSGKHFGMTCPIDLSRPPPELVWILRSEWTETVLFISLSTEISGIFGIMESTLGQSCFSPLEAIRLRSSLFYWNTTVEKNYFLFPFIGFSLQEVCSLRRPDPEFLSAFTGF